MHTLGNLSDFPSGFNSAAYAKAMDSAVIAQSGGTLPDFDPNALADTSGGAINNVVHAPDLPDDNLCAWACAFNNIPWSQRYQAVSNLGTPIDNKLNYSANGAPAYGSLNATPTQFASVSIDKPILQPHFTTALDWCLPPGQSGVLNIGNPTSQYDTIEFLRSALIDSDWNRVYYWFLSLYGQLYKSRGPDKNAFFPFADMNILQYKYVVQNGRKIYYPFSLYDIKNFLNLIVANFTISDLTHSRSTCGIGLINWVPEGTPNSSLDPKNAHDWNDWRTQFTAGLNPGYLSGHGNGASSVFQYESMVDLVKATESQAYSQFVPCGNFRVGWLQGLRGDLTTTTIVTTIILILATYGAAYAAGLAAAATTTGATAATTVPEVAATTAAASASGAAASGVAAGAAGAAALDEVVVTGIISSVSASTVAATAAGLVAATVPVVVSSGASSAVTNASQGSVLNNAQNANVANDGLDEVIVTGTASTGAASSALTGAVVATASVPVVASSTAANTTTQGTQTQSQSQSQSNSGNSQSNSPKSSIQTQLEKLIAKYGLGYVQKYLQQLLGGSLGRTPTAQELSSAQQYLGMEGQSAASSSNTGLIIALAGLGLLAMSMSK